MDEADGMRGVNEKWIHILVWNMKGGIGRCKRKMLNES
jgi:hypothetical protein